MRVKSISVEMSVTRSANYQSATNSVGLVADLENDEDAATAVKRLQGEAFALLLKRFVPKRVAGEEDQPVELR